MHAEMHAIYALTGMSPSFRKQRAGKQLERETPPFKGSAPFAAGEGHPEQRLSRAIVA